jgi:hypothetical protein
VTLLPAVLIQYRYNDVERLRHLSAHSFTGPTNSQPLQSAQRGFPNRKHRPYVAPGPRVGNHRQQRNRDKNNRARIRHWKISDVDLITQLESKHPFRIVDPQTGLISYDTKWQFHVPDLDKEVYWEYRYGVVVVRNSNYYLEWIVLDNSPTQCPLGESTPRKI